MFYSYSDNGVCNEAIYIAQWSFLNDDKPHRAMEKSWLPLNGPCLLKYYSYSLGGHSNSSATPLASGWVLDTDSDKWREMTAMTEARKDHACLYVELESTKGLLVTGGLGVDGQVLHSAEFYDIKAKKWSQVSSLKIGRTEHSMALIYGIPTAIGGKV